MGLRYLFILGCLCLFTACLEKGGEKESVIAYGVMRYDSIHKQPVMDIGKQSKILLSNPAFDELTIGGSYIVNYWKSKPESSYDPQKIYDVNIYSPPIPVPSGIVDSRMMVQDTMGFFQNEGLISSISYDEKRDYIGGHGFITVNFPSYYGQAQEIHLCYNPLAEPDTMKGKNYYDLFFRLRIQDLGDIYNPGFTNKLMHSYELESFMQAVFQKEREAGRDTFYVRLKYAKDVLKTDSTKMVWGDKSIMYIAQKKQK